MNATIFCTIWIKEDNHYTGTFSNCGDPLQAGANLYNYYSTFEKAKELINTGAKSSIGDSIETCENYENGGEIIFRDLSYDMMKSVTKEYTRGAYIYIYDKESDRWMFGYDMKITLEKVLN